MQVVTWCYERLSDRKMRADIPNPWWGSRRKVHLHYHLKEPDQHYKQVCPFLVQVTNSSKLDPTIILAMMKGGIVTFSCGLFGQVKKVVHLPLSYRFPETVFDSSHIIFIQNNKYDKIACRLESYSGNAQKQSFFRYDDQ